MDPAVAQRDGAWLTDLPSILDKIRDRLGSSEEEPEVEEEVDEREPNPLEGDVVSGAGLEVGELVDKISRERGVDFVDASRGLYRALEDGRVRLVDPSPPRSVLGFFSPVYSAWFLLVVGFVGLMIFSIYLMPQLYPLNYLRIGAGAIFVLYVPGYTLIEALYSRRDELERLERFGLSVGLSLAVVPLVGLVLNYTPWGIRLDPALVALSLLTLALAVVAVYRKYGYWRLARGV
jgi:hypothetical protein